MGIYVPEYPLVLLITWAYTIREEEAHPLPVVRIGVTSSHLRQVFEVGMSSHDIEIVRDAAIMMFSFCFNRLRENSVVSLKAFNVEIMEYSMTCRPSFVKGKPAS